VTNDPSLRGLALSLLASAVLLLLWGFYRHPGQRLAWQELRALQSQLGADASSATDIGGQSTQLAAHLRTTQAQLLASRARYPLGVTEAGLMRELERRTRVHRLSVEALTLSDRAGPPGVVHWTVDLRVTGRYPDLMAFAGSLETPERDQALASLKLSLSQDPERLEMRLRYLLNSRTTGAFADPPTPSLARDTGVR
jgi:Tfp pilus assembly protein PilO